MAITNVNLSDTFRQFVQKVNTISTNLGDIDTIYSDSDVINTINLLKGLVDDLETAVGLPLSNLTTTDKTDVISSINELDGEIGVLSTLTTTSKSTLVSAINELDSDVGSISTLNTTDKSSVVNAINELDFRIINVYDSDETLLNP